MKKVIALALTAVMALAPVSSVFAEDMRVAMVTDYGDINDQSFNQTTYEACKEYCEENAVDFTYYKPEGDSTADRAAMIDMAAADGYTVVVMPGYAFAEAIVEEADMYPDVKFVALDVSQYDLDTASGEEGYTRDNVYSAVYQEELAGYMAGVAAVKLGYTKLGFLGGMAVPAVIRYGYGFVQGANDAAKELDIKVDVKYTYQYGASFAASNELQTLISGWYQNGTEVVFSCGGSIFQSITAAASANDGLVIGVDVDQSPDSDTVITSAMKGLASAAQWAIGKAYDGTWAEIGGNGTSLGVKEDAVGLPTATWSLKNYKASDYESLYKKVLDGSVTIDDQAPTAEGIASVSFSNVVIYYE